MKTIRKSVGALKIFLKYSLIFPKFPTNFACWYIKYIFIRIIMCLWLFCQNQQLNTIWLKWNQIHLILQHFNSIRLINIILFLGWLFSPLETYQFFKNIDSWTFIYEEHIITYFVCCLYCGCDVVKMKFWKFSN